MGKVTVVGGGRASEPVTGTPLGEIAVGSSIYLNVNGTRKEFLVINQGIPSNSSLYDSSCNGTWLLMKDVYEKRAFDSTPDHAYENSDIHAYLNGTFLGLFDSDIQSIIKQVKLPYRKGSGLGTTIVSGASGLATKIFCLSAIELGWTQSDNSRVLNDGACLSYFYGCATADKKRSGYLNGTATDWWLRTPMVYTSDFGSQYANTVQGSGGSLNFSLCSSAANGSRPALVLPSDAKLFDDGTIKM